MKRLIQFVVQIVCTSVVLALAAATASASIGTGLTLGSSSSVAASNPDLTISTSFSGDSAPASFSVRLPQGMRLAPGAVAPPCSVASAELGECAPQAKIGTASATLASGATGEGELFLTEPPASSAAAGIAFRIDFPNRGAAEFSGVG